MDINAWTSARVEGTPTRRPELFRQAGNLKSETNRGQPGESASSNSPFHPSLGLGKCDVDEADGAEVIIGGARQDAPVRQPPPQEPATSISLSRITLSTQTLARRSAETALGSAMPQRTDDVDLLPCSASQFSSPGAGRYSPDRRLDDTWRGHADPFVRGAGHARLFDSLVQEPEDSTFDDQGVEHLRLGDGQEQIFEGNDGEQMQRDVWDGSQLRNHEDEVLWQGSEDAFWQQAHAGKRLWSKWEDELILREQANDVLRHPEEDQVARLGGLSSGHELLGTIHASEDLLGWRGMDVPVGGGSSVDMYSTDATSTPERSDGLQGGSQALSDQRRYDPSRYRERDSREASCVAVGEWQSLRCGVEEAEADSKGEQEPNREHVADDLSTMLDSLEMQSALLQGHLRECAQQIHERRLARDSP